MKVVLDDLENMDPAIDGDMEVCENPDEAGPTSSAFCNKRRSYTREKKLQILQAYYQNNCNKYKTCKTFGVSKQCLIRWVRNEEQIKKGREGSKRVKGCGRKAFWPDVEVILANEFQELRKKGLKVKYYHWFLSRAKQLMTELHPDVDFRFSQGWYDRFKARNHISLRRTTKVAHNEPSEIEVKIRDFHHKIRRIASRGENRGPLGQFELSTVANVAQTPLPYTFNGGQGCDQTEAQTVSNDSTASGLEKRQCTVQLTLFADGEPRVKPLLIFHGEGSGLSQDERQQYDERVMVELQDSAWCGEPMMLWWLDQMWKRPTCPDAEKPRLLIVGMNNAQKTANIQQSLAACKTTVVPVPPDCTNLVQPLDVAFNEEFKAAVSHHQDEHVREILELYLNSSLTASNRRILITKWVGAAWEEASQKKEMVRHAFEKCGISVPIDGSNDSAINICGLEHYSVNYNYADDSENEEDLFELDLDSDLS